MRLAALPALLLLASTAQAATITVGPERALKLPSQAVKEAGEGDTIAIEPGEYYDCLKVGTPRLTIAGLGDGAVLTDTTCDGKAIIVTGADGLTLRNLTLQRARVGDGNGAGIRAESGSLTVENVRFLNDQAGLLAGALPGATIVIRDSRFEATGNCNGNRCASTITVGRIARLVIERTLITGTRGAHQVVSSARATEITGSRLEDGPKGSASFLLMLPEGGSLKLEGNILQKGPRAANLRGAVLVDGEITGPFIVRHNRFINATGSGVPFILNWSDDGPELEGNEIIPPGDEVSSAGYMRNRAGNLARDAKAMARGLARKLLGR
jgi:hypothetical protein